MPSGAKPGERRGGRSKGTKNKATLEREQRVLDELRGRAARLTPQVWAKDALEDMIPEAQELVRSIKTVVGRLQAIVFTDLGSADANVARAAATSKLLDKVHSWTVLLKDAEATASLIASRAGEYQSPKLHRVAVGLGIGMMGAGALPAPDTAAATGESKVITIDDPAALARVYARMVQEAA